MFENPSIFKNWLIIGYSDLNKKWSQTAVNSENPYHHHVQVSSKVKQRWMFWWLWARLFVSVYYWPLGWDVAERCRRGRAWVLYVKFICSQRGRDLRKKKMEIWFFFFRCECCCSPKVRQFGFQSLLVGLVSGNIKTQNPDIWCGKPWF